MTCPGGKRGLIQFIESALVQAGAEVRSFDTNYPARSHGEGAIKLFNGIPLVGSRVAARLERRKRGLFASEFNAGLSQVINDWHPDIWLAVLSWADSTSRELLDRASNLYRIGWLVDDPFLWDGGLAKLLGGFDRIYAVDGSWVWPIKLISGQPASMLACGADPELNYPLPPETIPVAFKSDISFVGTSYSGQPAGLVRRQVLSQVSDLGLSIFGDPGWLKPESAQDPVPGCYKGGELDATGVNLVYNSAAISLNIHHPQWRLGTSLRTFAIAASGAFQLLDYRPGLEEFFVPDKEVVTFSSATELREKARYYLSNPSERARIAAAALDRVRSEHTYLRRITQILNEAGALPRLGEVPVTA